LPSDSPVNDSFAEIWRLRPATIRMIGVPMWHFERAAWIPYICNGKRRRDARVCYGMRKVYADAACQFPFPSERVRY